MSRLSIKRFPVFMNIVIAVISLMVSAAAQARLHLELTQSANATLPIAVLPFSGDAVTLKSGQSVSDVIHNDLANSGQFSLKAPAYTGEVTLQNADQVNWRAQGVDYVLVGQLQSKSFGQYQLTVELLSVYGNGQQGAPQVLWSRKFSGKQDSFRQIAHHISDLVYQQLTGVPGIFNTKVAYILVKRFPKGLAEYRLEVADADGYNAQTLLTSPLPIMSVSWSPDGRSIAYVSFEGHRSGVYVQDIRSGHRSRISQFRGINGAPAFSPDGKQLAIVLTRSGNPKIYTLNLATKQLTQLTHGFSIDTEPSWSPDGRSLIFTSNRGGSPQIYRYDFASNAIKRLTYKGNYNARASYTANGRAIVMMHRDVSAFSIGRLDIASGRFQVLTPAGADESPSVAPNGKMILYATQYHGRGVLSVVSIDGRVKLRLPAGDGNVQEPAWSPFLDAMAT